MQLYDELSAITWADSIVETTIRILRTLSIKNSANYTLHRLRPQQIVHNLAIKKFKMSWYPHEIEG